ncbi:MAG TPA: CcmD family protein [Thermoguttaceae bacterium]|nr:CcmD family protein [Thermoguttaceae bacterium]
MGAFAAAYSIVWIAVLLYVWRLGRRQRRLLRTVEALRLQLEQSPDRENPGSKAA